MYSGPRITQKAANGSETLWHADNVAPLIRACLIQDLLFRITPLPVDVPALPMHHLLATPLSTLSDELKNGHTKHSVNSQHVHSPHIPVTLSLITVGRGCMGARLRYTKDFLPSSIMYAMQLARLVGQPDYTVGQPD